MLYLISHEWRTHKEAVRELRRRRWTAESIEAVLATMSRMGMTKPEPEAPVVAKKRAKRKPKAVAA